MPGSRDTSRINQVLITDVNGDPVSVDTTGLASSTGQTDSNNRLGATNETVAASDTATSGLNGLFKRALQGITTMIATLGRRVMVLIQPF